MPDHCHCAAPLDIKFIGGPWHGQVRPSTQSTRSWVVTDEDRQTHEYVADRVALRLSGYVIGRVFRYAGPR